MTSAFFHPLIACSEQKLVSVNVTSKIRRQTLIYLIISISWLYVIYWNVLLLFFFTCYYIHIDFFCRCFTLKSYMLILQYCNNNINFGFYINQEIVVALWGGLSRVSPRWRPSYAMRGLSLGSTNQCPTPHPNHLDLSPPRKCWLSLCYEAERSNSKILYKVIKGSKRRTRLP